MAKIYIPDAHLEDFCFQAQQAAEKAIKAVLIMERIEVPYVHGLADLLALLENARNGIPDHIWKSAELTPYAAVTRYPGAIRPVSVEEIPNRHSGRWGCSRLGEIALRPAASLNRPRPLLFLSQHRLLLRRQVGGG